MNKNIEWKQTRMSRLIYLKKRNDKYSTKIVLFLRALQLSWNYIKSEYSVVGQAVASRVCLLATNLMHGHAPVV